MGYIKAVRASAVAGILVLMAPSSFGAGPRHFVRDHPAAAVAKLKPVGILPGTNKLQLAINLPARNEADLDQLIKDLYNPASSKYHQYLTPQQFAERFGPTVSDYQAVINFARKNGLKVTGTHASRLVLDVAGSVTDIERTFQLKLEVYDHPKEHRKFHAPNVEPSVDSTLSVPLLSISGLDDYSRQHPASLRLTPAKPPTGMQPMAGSGPGSTFIGRDFRLAYVPGTTLTGAGQSVALVAFDGYYSNDITAYETLAKISPVTLVNIKVNGGVPTPGADNIEVCLDIEMVMAMAPGVSKILVYEAPNGTAWTTILGKIADDNLASQVSCSWGGGTSNPNYGAETIFKQMAAQGQSFFCAAGDDDAFVGTVTFPSDSTNITQVGGTALTTASRGGARVSETVWNRNNGVGTGGGISTIFAIPSWQQGIESFQTNGGSTAFRNSPDVALTAENVYVKSDNGSGGSVGGTSCAAPLWAGFMALVNQQAANDGKPAVGFINPAVFEIANESIYSSTFNDITTGNNASTTSPNAFYAVPGYDLCTGLGTPRVSLINALVNPDSLVVVSNFGFSAIGTPDATFNVSSQTFYLTNSGTSSLVWSLINTSAWLSVSSNGGTLDAGAGDSVVVGLNTVASNLTAGTYTTKLWFSNATSGVGHSRLFTLKTSDPLLILPSNSIAFTGPPGGPFAPQNGEIVLTNPSASTLNWGINNTSAWFNVSALNGSMPPGGQANISIAPTPAAANLADGIYAATFQVTNLASQSVQLITGTLAVGIIQNGGFETGDFTDWTLVGNGTLDGSIYNAVIGVDTLGDGTGADFIHSGNYGAFFGDTNLATVSQSFQTTPGTSYRLSFWLVNPVSGSGQQFKVNWNTNSLGNNQIFFLNNPPAFSWTNITFVVKATDTNTTLQFVAQNPPNGFGVDDVAVTVILPPVFTVQPTNLTLLAGDTAWFGASVSGTVPLSYQWRKNDANLADGNGISGVTAASLMLAEITGDSAGDYTLYVTNVYGSATSSIAALTVLLPPVIGPSFTNQTVECGGDVDLELDISGAQPMTYQWTVDNWPVPEATSNLLTLTDVHGPDHLISVTVTNIFGSVTSNIVLSVADTVGPVITLAGPNPMYVEFGAGFADPGATALDVCSGAASVISNGTVNLGVLGTNFITYRSTDGNSNTNTVTRTVIVRDTTPPVITWSFTNLVLATDTNCGALMPDVTGTNFIQATDLSGALTVSQEPTNNFELAYGTNQVVITVSDSSGNAAYSTNFAIVEDQVPPQIFSQPQSRASYVATVANFNVAAVACSPLSFQWFFNNDPIENATNTSFAVGPLTLTNAGDYSVTITSAGGITNSAIAVLTIYTNPPNITGVIPGPGGSFTLNFSGIPGGTYVLETSTNFGFSASWLPIVTNTFGPDGLWEFTDFDATNYGRRFYRLKIAE